MHLENPLRRIDLGTSESLAARCREAGIDYPSDITDLRFMWGMIEVYGDSELRFASLDLDDFSFFVPDVVLKDVVAARALLWAKTTNLMSSAVAVCCLS